MKTRDFFSSTVSKLECFERESSLVKDPSRLTCLRQQASEWAQRVLPQINDHLAGLRHEFTSQYMAWGLRLPPEGSEHVIPRVVSAHDFRARLGKFGARLMEAFEAVFNTWLALKIWAVDSTFLTAVVVSLATLAFCEGFGRLFGLHLNKRSEVPEESRQRIGHVLVPTAVVWLVSFYFTCVLRVAAGGIAVMLGPFTSLIFGVLEVATLILVAIGFAWDELYGWSRRDSENYSKYLDLHGRVQALVLKREGPEPESEQEPAGALIPAVAAHSPGLAVALLGAFLLASMTIPAAIHAQTNTVTTPNEGASFFDVSTSANALARSAAIEVHRRVIATTMLNLDLTNWSFIQFTSDGWTAPSFTVAHAAQDHSSCGPVHFSEAGKLFAPSRQQEIAEAEERCHKAREQAAKLLQDSVNTSINLLLKNNDAQPSKCTSVFDAIERVARTPKLRAATIVTDGNENCGGWRYIAAPNHPEEVVLVLIAQNDDAGKRCSEGTLFETRKRRLLKAAPWLTIIPAFELSSDAFSVPATSSLARNIAAH